MIRSIILALLLVMSPPVCAEGVRLKDMGRFLGWRDNPLVGYGLVTGLSGSGDSPRSEITRQALKNVLSRLGANIPAEQLQSRNVAAVMVTATLPPSANVGDRIDVSVSSIGDARSLVGGTLLMTPLLGPDQRNYALAQGAVIVGGYRFDSNLNSQQKNYPTAGVLPSGATVEMSVPAELVADQGMLTFILKDPDFTTAGRIAEAINLSVGPGSAMVRGADAVRIRTAAWPGNTNQLLARIEDVAIEPDQHARVVINERSGTVVAGGAVQISSVVISQGDVKVAVSVDNQAGPVPYFVGAGSTSNTLVVSNTKLEVSDSGDAAIRLPNTTVADLVQGLNKLHVSTRAMIAIMQAMKAAGALHADVIVQ
jgi:flagellar P-ring protein precursor FlgI